MNTFSDEMWASIEEDLQKGLVALLMTQVLVSSQTEGCIPGIDVLPTSDQLRTYALALIGEVYEWLQELNWKPWKKTQKPFNPVFVLAEFADILAFLGILIVYVKRMSMSTQDIAAAYVYKSKKNIDRFNGSY